MLFDVRTVRVGEWDVVRVLGDVDLSSLPTLRTQIDRAEAACVALDLVDVDLFDPLAFGVVIAAALRCARNGSSFAVICPPGRPRELFAESGVDRIVTVVGSPEQLPGAGSQLA